MKLVYKILGRRPLENLPDVEAVDVEWTRDDGGVFEDHVLVPSNHPAIHHSMKKTIEYEKVPDGTRAVLIDQVNITKGAHNDEVESVLIKKRQRIAENFGLTLE